MKTIDYLTPFGRIDNAIIETIQKIKEKKRLEELEVAAASAFTASKSNVEDTTLLYPFNASNTKRQISVGDKSLNKSNATINEKDNDQISMAKAVRRWSNNNTNKPILNRGAYAATTTVTTTTTNNNGDSGFNESTDTNLVVTPPNGKINFESEKTTMSLIKKNRNQVTPEVTK